MCHPFFKRGREDSELHLSQKRLSNCADSLQTSVSASPSAEWCVLLRCQVARLLLVGCYAMTSLLSTCHRSVIFAAENNRVTQSSVPQRVRSRRVLCAVSNECQRMFIYLFLFCWTNGYWSTWTLWTEVKYLLSLLEKVINSIDLFIKWVRLIGLFT